MDSILNSFVGFAQSTGVAKLVEMFQSGDWVEAIGTPIMIIIACVLLYLAIVKKFEPLLLLPIAFGMLL